LIFVPESPRTWSFGVSNIIGRICHVLFLIAIAVLGAGAQERGSALPLAAGDHAIPLPAASAPQHPARRLRIQRPNPVPVGYVQVGALDRGMKDGPWYRLRGKSYVETAEFLLKADDIDYNEDTGYVEARGNVYLQHFEQGEELWADRAEYYLDSDTGKFYNVRGSARLDIDAKPGLLTTENPFTFGGKWAEKLKEKYILHDGFITNCKMPNPWWVLKGPTFDIVPDERAISRRTVFWVRGKVPIFYAPYFYKSLEKLPRKSGFLTPNIGNSSRRGKMVGVGYYWAINRSYDATYQMQYFTERGPAHTIDFRGKPNDRTDFNLLFYGVQDRGLLQPDGTRVKQGGYLLNFIGRSELGDGFYARVEGNYLSSFVFRQNFMDSFTEATNSEVHSTGFVGRDWNGYGVTFLFQRLENFQSDQPNDTVVIRKLPQAEYRSVDRQIWDKLPIWVSWDSSAGLLGRTQLAFQTRQFLERLDAYPRVTTSFGWKGFTLTPSFAVRESHWGESRQGYDIIGQNINRRAREFGTTLELPSLERIYNGPKWLGQLKHVIEADATYTYITGVNVFDQLIPFDETELYSNTNQVEFAVTNRLYAKRNGSVNEILTWRVAQQRYFDPTFGGAVIPGQRNIVLSTMEFSPFAFLDGPRNYSPVSSSLRISPKGGLGVEWRADYDPLRGKMVDSGITADARFGKYIFSLGHTTVAAVPLQQPGQALTTYSNLCQAYADRELSLLSPCASQLQGTIGYGEVTKPGWSVRFSPVYDFRQGVLRYATTQFTYNTDCCGVSLQYIRFGNIGGRNDTQFRLSFQVANLGSFGTLKRQERIY
jgi:LPS-assembly protein